MQAIKKLSLDPTSDSKSHAFICLVRFEKSVGRWHTICSIHDNKQDWLPGVARTQPRLGFWFWGVSSEKGGLHQPPFSFPRWLTGVFEGGCNFPRVSLNSYTRRRATPCVYFLAYAIVYGIIPMRARRRSPTDRLAGAKKRAAGGGTGRSGVGMEGTWSEISPVLRHLAQGEGQAVPLRSRAAGRCTGADTR